MFIRNDAPTTPENLRWRSYEKWGCFAFSVLVIGRATLSIFEVSQLHGPEIHGLTESMYGTEYLIDVNDGQLKRFRENLPLLCTVFSMFLLGS
jgi:hypothetical protein